MLPSPLSSAAGRLTSAIGAQYICPVQGEGTRRKRSRVQPWMFISKVQTLYEQLKFMVFGTGAKSNSSFIPHTRGSNIQVFCWKSLNQRLFSLLSPCCFSPTGPAKSMLLLYPPPIWLTVRCCQPDTTAVSFTSSGTVKEIRQY